MQQVSDSIEQPFLPRYEVAGIIGEGAAARVYRVVDKRDGSTKAVKALKPEPNAEPSVVKRFEDEYRILRRLHHPSLPNVYDYGFAKDGCRYMAMELVDGERLDVYYAARPGDLWLLLYELCEVLSFIHSHHLLHLDLKPANILVKQTSAFGDSKPMVVLMDFGLSYRRDVGESVSLVGTPEYMAPEIIRGEQQLTRAVDYYSLGVTLYELLSGETPFRGEIRDVFAAHLTREIRFQEEKTEHAELYPHVLGLVTKDSRARLEAFEGFRRAVVGRLVGGMDELDRAYGMSFISSIGMIGKKEVWRTIMEWSDAIDSIVAAKDRRPREPASEPASPTSKRGRDQKDDRHRDAARSLESQLLADVQPSGPVVSSDEQTEVRSTFTVLALGGTVGSGKTYLINELAEACRLRGRAVWHLRSGTSTDGRSSRFGDFWRLLEDKDHSTRRSRGADPKGALMDRYMNGWSLLTAESTPNGAVLIADDYDELEEERKEFLEYVAKRLQIAGSEGETPDIYMVLAGNDAKFARRVSDSFEDKVESKPLVIPPLQKRDVADIVDRFSGKMASVSDRKNLEEFISRFDERASIITTVLSQVLLKDALLYLQGRWQFRLPTDVNPQQPADLFSYYYRDFLSDLPAGTRGVMEWLCCHEGPIQVEILESVSGVAAAGIEEIVGLVEVIEILEVSDINGVRNIGLVSRNTQQVLYDSIDSQRKAELHGTYVQEYNGRLKLLTPDEIGTQVSFSTQLVYQYKQLGESRKMLVLQLRIMRQLKKEKRLYDLRRVIVSSIQTLDVISGSVSRGREWHIRLYFIKQLIGAHWLLSDFQSIVRLVEAFFGENPNGIPTNFTFKYCVSLIYTGEYDDAMAVMGCVRRRIRNRDSEPYVLARLTESIVLNYKGEYRKSLEILRSVEGKKYVLGEYALCRLYLNFISIYDKTGDEKQANIYIPLTVDLAKKKGFTNEYLAAMLAQFNVVFGKSELSECKRLVRSAIAIALRSKTYQRLAEWYFTASAVYYEEGLYENSIRYVNKALQLTAKLGLVSEVPELLIRLAMNYQNMGLFGNAIKHVEQADKAARGNQDTAKGAVRVLFNLDIHLAVNSEKADACKKAADRFMMRFRGKPREGYYWYLVGLYHYKKSEMNIALDAFKKARRLYEVSGSTDDAVRSGVKEAMVLTEIGRFREAKRVGSHVNNLRKRFESKNIEAEYWTQQLAYHYYIRCHPRVIRRYLEKCEEAAREATEVPVLLATDKMTFRARARLGDRKGAKRIFNNYLRRIKKIVSNMPDQEWATSVLSERDEHLFFQEFKIMSG